MLYDCNDNEIVVAKRYGFLAQSEAIRFEPPPPEPDYDVDTYAVSRHTIYPELPDDDQQDEDDQ